MRKSKKLLILIFSIIFISFIYQQLYYTYKYEGNLVIYISNESLIDSAQLEIYIDGNKILESSLTNEVTHLNKSHSVKTAIGNHVAVIKINGETSKEIKFNTILSTFIFVDYYGDRFSYLTNKEDHFVISISKRPMRYMM